MIDVKELRIGSHYYNSAWTGNPIGRVTSIDGGIRNPDDTRVVLFYDCPYDKDSDPYEGAMLNYLEPVPLTAELLQEFGFEPVRKTLGKPEEEWNKEIDGYPIRVMKGYSNNPECEWSVHIDRWDYDTIGSADVAYLHQLEGIIYLCTNCELMTDYDRPTISSKAVCRKHNEQQRQRNVQPTGNVLCPCRSLRAGLGGLRHKGQQPETPDEFFNDAPDCRYFDEGYCRINSPGIRCERKGCMAYYPKETRNNE